MLGLARQNVELLYRLRKIQLLDRTANANSVIRKERRIPTIYQRSEVLSATVFTRKARFGSC